MKKVLMVLCLTFSATFVFAGQFEVRTGYGYFLDIEGKVYCKATLPAGSHPIKDGYSYIEVADKEEMDSIEVYVEPKTEDEVNEEKITEKIREKQRKDAIEELKGEGELPSDFKDHK